ncbi:MAG: 2-oxoacid:acceptor oxidoreductase subunit alpha [Actinomycetota bacterium]
MTKAKTVEEKTNVVVRFAGDSGDGIQLTGDRFTVATAVLGNDLATLPDFPAEIRAPAGTIAGVSAFQIHFASEDILTPGDHPNVLVALNPAALKAELSVLEKGGTVIVNEDAFIRRNLDKAGFTTDPLEDGTLDGYKLYRVPMTSITTRALEGMDLAKRDIERSKNMFALGLVSWMYGRPIDVTIDWINGKFAANELVAAANVAAFKAGYNFGETTELFEHSYYIKAAPARPGTYRNVTGATALAWGLVAASVKSGLPMFYSSYPITPASELLHELARLKNFGVKTLQAEDEIAACNIALGAAFGGQLGVTGTSGPGMDLKEETIGLAVALELPLVIVDVQRAGPSTGLPTKTEQSDLLMALYGRHGESPLPVLAPRSPSQCFEVAFEAVRIAVTYRTPVILLSDTFLGNSSEPWLLPDIDAFPAIDPKFAGRLREGETFQPYERDANLARPWAVPGTPGLRHRIGGLEKEDVTGDISYDPLNHERMTHLRAARIAKIGESLPPLEVSDPDGDAELLVLGWGSSFGAIRAAARRVRDRDMKVATVHLEYLNPLPPNTGDVVRAYPRVLIPEMNMGQLSKIIRGEFLVDAIGFNKVQGLPIFADELQAEIETILR